eukprot:1132777_1
MEMLSAPDGVLCGGETLMYYESPLDLATDEDKDVIYVLQCAVWQGKNGANFVIIQPDLRQIYMGIVFDKQFGVLDSGGGSNNRTYSDTVSRVVTAYDPMGIQTVFLWRHPLMVFMCLDP